MIWWSWFMIGAGSGILALIVFIEVCVWLAEYYARKN